MKNVLLMTLFLAGSLAAQNELLTGGIRLVHDGFDQGDESQMVQGKALLERALAVMPEDPDVLYWIAFADYRLSIKMIYWREGVDKAKAEKLIDNGIECLEKANAKKPSSEALALLGSLTGMSIQFSPISGMWKGPKSNGQFADAIKLNPENPRAYYLQGIGKVNTPEMFGGGAEKAIPSFVKAVELFEKEAANKSSAPENPTWGYSECLAFLGNAYLTIQDDVNAKKYFEQALVINPNARLAKTGLAKLEKAKSK